MNIQEASTKRKELQDLIQTLLADFSSDTGLTVECINLERLEGYGRKTYLVTVDARLP